MYFFTNEWTSSLIKALVANISSLTKILVANKYKIAFLLKKLANCCIILYNKKRPQLNRDRYKILYY